jgi:hypothetical protein
MARRSSRCSRQYFSHAGLLFVAGVIGFPLSLLVFLDLGIGPGLLLFDRLTQNPVLDPLPLHLPLMIIEGAIEGIGSFFGLLTAFPVELACIVHALAGSIGPASHMVESLLEGFPLFRDL